MATARASLISSLLLLAGVVAAVPPGDARHVATPSSGTSGYDFNPKSVRVYVSLFDINAAPAQEPVKTSQPTPPQKLPSSPPASSVSPNVTQDAGSAAKQAERLKIFFSDTLVQALRKTGFNATPLASSHPDKGVLIKGVFAEVDSQNHNCLAILGGTTPAPSFVLYVGAYNLARPDQPLYRVMTMENCGAQFGPLINLNNYIPMEKYDVSKSPTEDEVRKVCGQVVANLRALLTVNSAAFSN